jgi:hypothetical protein
MPPSSAAVLTLLSTPPSLESCVFRELSEFEEVFGNDVDSGGWAGFDSGAIAIRKLVKGTASHNRPQTMRPTPLSAIRLTRRRKLFPIQTCTKRGPHLARAKFILAICKAGSRLFTLQKLAFRFIMLSMRAIANHFLGLAADLVACNCFRKSRLMLASSFLVGTRFNSSRFSFASMRLI